MRVNALKRGRMVNRHPSLGTPQNIARMTLMSVASEMRITGVRRPQNVFKNFPPQRVCSIQYDAALNRMRPNILEWKNLSLDLTKHFWTKSVC